MIKYDTLIKSLIGQQDKLFLPHDSTGNLPIKSK